MNTTRRRYSAEFKFQVALEAAKGQQTTSELASISHAEGGALRMICAPRLLKWGNPFADHGFATFQQPLLLLRRQRNPYVYHLVFVDSWS